MKKLLKVMFSFFVLGLISSCGGENNSSLSLDINGLENLGSEASYEGWLIVDGAPVSTGVFTVDDSGNLSKTSFDVSNSNLEAASTFVLTIEPSPDNDPAPSDVHILAGDFTGTNASLSIGHPAALNNDFGSSEGAYILATPTDDDDTNEASGIWFLDNSSGAPVAGLNLPTLPAGWAYEGWAVIDGSPVSTGTFTNVSDADDSDVFSGANGGPPYPGEDFLVNAPSGLNFPVDIRGGMAVISIEPVPDNSPSPFVLKPLVGNIPASEAVHSVINMDQNLNFPSGNVSK